MGRIMLDKLFKNKKFIFIFTFAIEFIMYYSFNHMNFGGRFFIPDMGLAPVFGLIFGPFGGLGFACATFAGEFYWGGNFFASLLDSSILFFVSVLAYKLWYLIPFKEVSAPKFSSLSTIFKFVSVMFISSLVYLILLQISFAAFPSIIGDLYSLTSFLNQFSYAFNLFDFSIIYGLIFISAFNILKIPIKIPKKFKTKLNIPYKFFLIPLVLLSAFIIFAHTHNDIFTESVWSYLFFIIAFGSVILFSLNTFDVGNIQSSQYYSIIEKIIVLFFIIMIFFSLGIFDELHDVIVEFSFVNVLNIRFILMITIGLMILLSMTLTLIHIYFVEKLLTNPLKGLTEATNNYVVEGKLEYHKHTTFRIKNFMNDEDDMSVLINSFNSLSDIIKSNLNNLRKSTIEKERFKTEFNIAHDIQRGMLSTDFEEFSSNGPFEICAFMNPAKEVGGDFYDYFKVDDENIIFVVGDVSGKGVPASLFMVRTMHLIKNHSKFENNLSEVYEQVNNLACERNTDNLFVTSWIGKLNIKSGELSFVNAGHNHPLIRRNGGDFEYLETSPDLVLGVMEDMPYTENKINLKPGDMVFLYTDGVTEANNNYDGFYGDDRLKNTLNKYKDQKLNIIISELTEDIYQYCGTREQFDDLTMLIMKFEGD